MSKLLLAHKDHIRIGAAVWRGLLDSMFDPYRPECHYMRGPGPKWRAKQKG
jgi:hypothetical protein